MIRSVTRCALAMLLMAGGAFAIAPADFDNPQQRERFRELVSELRCMVCQNQSLADSDAALAEDMRREVLNLMKEGRSDDEIRTFLVERYGDFVLYDPPVKPTTWLLWFGPLLLFAAGAVTVAVVVWRRSAAGGSEASQ